MPKKIGVYVWKAFVVILFTGFSALALFFAYGYQFDFKERDFKKTSIIDITSGEKDVSVLLDGTRRAETMPFQVKSVVPGKHLLAVEKTGFRPWMREILVEEDLVTIVDDVLLVPSDVEKMVKPLEGFTLSGGEVFNARDYLVEVDQDGKVLKLTGLFGDGTFKSEEIELFKSGIKNLEPLADENFLIFFMDGNVSWVDFRDKRFVYFRLPEGAHTVKIGSDREMIYFLNNGGLYGVPFQSVEGFSGDAEKYLIAVKVEAYVPDSGGDIYFISGGMLFRSDSRGREKKLVDYAPEFYKNIDFLEGIDYGALVLRDRADRRHLVLTDGSGGLTYLSGGLKGRPLINGYDQFLYTLQSGEIYFYDPRISQKRLVVKMEADFEVLGWFSDAGHFLIREEGAVKMRDVFNANTYELLGDTENISSFFTLKGSLFFMRGKTLNVLNWSTET